MNNPPLRECLKDKISIIRILDYNGYIVDFHPYNFNHLKYQVNNTNMVYHWGKDIEGCVYYIVKMNSERYMSSKL